MARAAKQTRSRPAAKSSTAARKPRHGADFTVADDLAAYREMLLIRRFEERAAQLYGQAKIGGFLHLYIGQEAVVVGLQALVVEGDEVITAYRDHGHMLAAGMDPGRVMAELMGRRDGYSGGKGGSMDMFSREADFFGGHGIVGAPAPLGTGIAFANRYRKNDRICFTYFGEGAANQGQVYEAFNMAGLWEAAGALRHREQPLRHGHRIAPHLGPGGFLAPRRLPSTFRASASTAWTSISSARPDARRLPGAAAARAPTSSN